MEVAVVAMILTARLTKLLPILIEPPTTMSQHKNHTDITSEGHRVRRKAKTVATDG